VMMAEIEALLEVPGIDDKAAERMQRSSARVVAEEEEELRQEASQRRAEAEASPIGMAGERQKLLEVRGIGEQTIKQLEDGGYFTLMQVHQEENIVKLGEVTGLTIKKARQVKQAITAHLDEQARAALMPLGGALGGAAPGPVASPFGSPTPAGAGSKQEG